MPEIDLQSLCELGQRQLMEMRYLEATATLARAEEIAWAARDFDTLARLYMPLQESRRQVRQRCGEGTVRLDLVARSAEETPAPGQLADLYPQGQLLVAGWASIEPAAKLRELQASRGLFAETFLAAAYPVGDARAVVIVALPDAKLPDASPRSIDKLLALVPPHSVVMHEQELPGGAHPGTPETYARTMELWERLHAPFLAAADAEQDPIRRIEAYRKTIRVDPACELAHQKLSDLARELGRAARGST